MQSVFISLLLRDIFSSAPFCRVSRVHPGAKCSISLLLQEAFSNVPPPLFSLTGPEFFFLPPLPLYVCGCRRDELPAWMGCALMGVMVELLFSPAPWSLEAHSPFSFQYFSGFNCLRATSTFLLCAGGALPLVLLVFVLSCVRKAMIIRDASFPFFYRVSCTD